MSKLLDQPDREELVMGWLCRQSGFHRYEWKTFIFFRELPGSNQEDEDKDEEEEDDDDGDDDDDDDDDDDKYDKEMRLGRLLSCVS